MVKLVDVLSLLDDKKVVRIVEHRRDGIGGISTIYCEFSGNKNAICYEYRGDVSYYSVIKIINNTLHIIFDKNSDVVESEALFSV